MNASILAPLLFVLGQDPVQSVPEKNDPRVGEARTACLAGDVPKGIRLLAELFTETRDPIWLFNQARCYQQNNQMDLAATRFREFLRKEGGMRPELVGPANDYLKEIDAQTSAARAAVTPPPPPTAARPSADVVTNAEGGQRDRGAVLRTSGLVVGSLGVLGLGAGVYFGLRVQSIEKEVEKEGTRADFVDNPEYRRKLTDGGRLETWQAVSYVVGAAALAGGATMFLGGRVSRPAGIGLAPAFGPGLAGASLHAAF